MDLEEAICGLVRYIYEEDDDYALKVVIIWPQIIFSDFEEEKSNSVEVDKNQDALVQGIRDAKYLMWGAVTWFSSNEYLLNICYICRKKWYILQIFVVILAQAQNLQIHKSYICKRKPHLVQFEYQRRFYYD